MSSNHSFPKHCLCFITVKMLEGRELVLTEYIHRCSVCVCVCVFITSNNNINNTNLQYNLWWLLSNMEQLVYNTLPLSYLEGILGVKGFTLASIKHKGVTFNCKGERR